MRTIEIVNLVCAILWALCIIGVSWCLYKANKTRTEAIKILDKIEKKSSNFDYPVAKGTTIRALLSVLGENARISTEIGIISSKEYQEEFNEDLDKELSSIRIWLDWDNDTPILQLIGIDNSIKEW